LRERLRLECSASLVEAFGLPSGLAVSVLSWMNYLAEVPQEQALIMGAIKM